jgi:glyoxylase-like metal-dependent hydrolase (beta-lactamase superfamily II)
MSRKHLSVLALWISSCVIPLPTRGQDPNSVVAKAAKAMGAESLKTIEWTGSGSNAGVGQNLRPTLGWPTTRVKSYTRQLDLNIPASNVQMVRVQNNGDVSQNQVIAPSSPWSRQFDLWVTPYGFLKGAMTNSVTVQVKTLGGVKYNVVSFALQGKYKVEGYLNSENLVERVRTWVDNDVLGDMLVEAVYKDYKDVGGLKVPSLMIVKQGGYATLILVASGAKANVPVTIPPAPAQPVPPAVTVVSEKIADGVYYLKGGTHHSVLVEFADHLTLIEAPLNEARSLALLAEIKNLYPHKPLTEVVNTHHHFDHSGGLRTMVDAGATIITQEINKEFYEQTFSAPRTLNPDRLEQSKKKANIVTVADKRVRSDATRTLELYLIKNNPHNEGILMAFLPREKILVEADLYTPPAPNAQAPAANAPVNPNALALVTNLETLRLDFETILPLHGPGKVTRADLYAFVQKPMVPVSQLVPPTGAGGAGRGGREGRGGRGGAAAGADAQVVALVNMACSACHSLDRVNNKKADREGWATTVERMKEKGAEIQALAFMSDITRVSTFMYSKDKINRTFPASGIKSGFHAASHTSGNAAAKKQFAQINRYHIDVLAYFVKKLQATPDGDGTLLDHSTIMLGSTMSNGDIHNHSPLPIVLVGRASGQIKGGRHVRYPQHTPLSNLLLTVLHKPGIPQESFGDSTGPLEI